MIASVSGTVLERHGDYAILEVGGVGLKVMTTPRASSALRTGERGTLHTCLVVREDSLTLYGFAEADERATFDVLLGVSGIGPRTALAVLSVHSPDELRRAVAAKNIAALTQVPGIGKKGAQRMILELENKLGPVSGDAVTTGEGAESDEVIAALVSLGWPESDARAAVAEVANEADSTSEALRAALQRLGRR
ncbi:MAG: Holliday junction branch migration protein RuvA [Flaviflexus sp.]|nr:Holliday junction branch migration protein RuvA [Flaviflexus sp.]